VTDNRITRRV